jgi:hypothetical protein
MALADGRASRRLLERLDIGEEGFEEHAVVCALGFLPRNTCQRRIATSTKRGVDFNAEANSSAELRRDQRGPAAKKKWLVDRLSRFAKRLFGQTLSNNAE